MTKYRVLDILPGLVGTYIKSKSTGYRYKVLRAVVDDKGVLWYKIDNVFGNDDREYWRADHFTVIHTNFINDDGSYKNNNANNHSNSSNNNEEELEIEIENLTIENAEVTVNIYNYKGSDKNSICCRGM